MIAVAIAPKWMAKRRAVIDTRREVQHAIDEFVANYIQPAMAAIVNKIEYDLRFFPESNDWVPDRLEPLG